MKKCTILFVIILLGLTALFAQAPEKFTYQAVVRDANNSLLQSSLVGVRISVLQGSTTGSLVYEETHFVYTNGNGLMTVVLGNGDDQQGLLSGIDWSNGPYFLKTDIDPNGGNNYSITSVQQLLSVPYALYAKEAANGFSGDYNDLTNRPVIPTVPTNVSAFTNDAGYLTSFTEQQVLSLSHDTLFLTGGSFVKLPVGFDGDYNSLTNKPDLFSGDYNDLTNQPTIPTVPTNVSAFTNDAGYLTSFTEQQVLTLSHDTLFLTGGSFVKLPGGFNGDYNSLTNKPELFSGNYNDLTNQPVIPTVPTNVSAFANDAGYLTGYTETDPQFNAWDKDYNDLINKPAIPTVPTNVTAFTNDAGYITQADMPGSLDIPTNVSAFVNDAGYITSNEIPEIPAVPTNVSQLNNDAGYITMNSIPTGLAGSNTGDIMYWDAATGTWIMMPAGSSGQVLTVENGVPVWANLPEYATMTLPPTVTTSAPSEVTQSSALCGGVVTNDGNVQLTACGVCWSTHHFPTTADAHTENDLSVSAFTSHIMGLAHQTTYYVRAYASNSVGTTYGAEMVFTTADIPSGSVTMPAPCSADTNTAWNPSLGSGSTLCAGTDSVELTLNNYQYGSIQWQYSLDTVSWFDISGATSTQLTYFPEQTQFVRAAVSYANCPTEYSAVKLLQKAPLAYAGISRTVSSGDTVHLQANTEEGATGSWQILQGANGFLTDPTDADSKFYGTDSLYRLRWTLTNSCGVSSDDISVRYVQTVLSDKVVMVDTTDIIFSDSAQMAQGFYMISFSDPNIVIGDSTILVSLINGGFLRRVDSWSMSNDTTYAMYTSQATLADLLQSGVIQIDAISGVNEVDTSVQNASPAQDMVVLDHIPTREELRSNPSLTKSGTVFVFRADMEQPDGSRVNLLRGNGSQNGSGVTNEVEFNKISWFGTKHLLDFGITLDNLDFDWKVKPTLKYEFDQNCLTFGVYNAYFKLTADLVSFVTASGQLNIVDWDIIKGTVFFAVPVGGVPIPFDFDYGINFSLEGSLDITETMRHRLTATATFTRGMRYYVKTDKVEIDKSNSGNTNIELVSDNTVITADLKATIAAYGHLKLLLLVGPRFQMGYKANIKYCHSMPPSTHSAWKGIITSNLFMKLDIKGAKIIDPILPDDWSKEWNYLPFERTYPYTISRYGGNSQIINATGPLASPIKVIVKGSGGKTIRNVPVYFRPKDGGSVSDSLVYTNQQGIAQTLWTPGEICGEHQLHAFVYDCEQHPIGGAPLVFNAYESADCANSTLDLHYNVSGNVLSLVATGGVPPYTYSVDGNAFVSTLPVLSATGNYILSVKDAHGCSYSITYGNAATSTCDWSNLDLAVETHNGSLTLEATGGTPPYQYSLEGIAYSATNVFTSLPAGNYTAYVQDAAGCVFSRSISIEEGSSGSSTDYSHPCAGAATVTDFDGNVYHTVQIGQQCWMKENMRTTHYVDGTFIPLGYGRFNPNDNAGNVAMYGYLYNWNVTTRDVSSGANPSGVQGICPYGWHVPSDAEWTQLTNYVSSQPQWRCEGSSDKIAKALASQQGWSPSSDGCTPGNVSFINNITGLSVLPAGGSYGVFGIDARYWSSTADYGGYAWNHRLRCDQSNVTRYGYGNGGATSRHSNAYSVRCLRD